ncbi:MAG: hypothetical protein R2864_03515 [Syntrophotaleaceae bacterium]
MRDIVSKEHYRDSGRIREVLATYQEAEDLINIGAYSAGSNPDIDHALDKIDDVRRFLRQDMNESVDFPSTLHELTHLFD